METAATFGVDATSREQEAATPIRGPRTVATGSPYALGNSSNGPAGTQTVQPGGKGNATGTGRPKRSNEQAGPDGAVTDGSPGRDGSLGQDSADSGREPGTAVIPEDRHSGEGTQGDTGSQGTTGINDDVPVVGSTGGGSRRKVVASKFHALVERYTPTCLKTKLSKQR